MVRTAPLSSSFERRSVRTPGDWLTTTWENGVLARWLESDGWILEPRNCGDSTWAVVAVDGRGDARVVATGLRGIPEAHTWIRRERRIEAREMRALLAAAPSTFDAAELGRAG